MLNIVCNVFLWLFGLAPSNPGLQELNNQLRYGQYHISMGVDGIGSLASQPGLIFTKFKQKELF